MFSEDRQYKSDMGRIVAQSIGGMVVKAVIAGMVIYVGMYAYDFVVQAFDPVKVAMGG